MNMSRSFLSLTRLRHVIPRITVSTERRNTDSGSPAIVEVGGITPIKQSGNPKPRVFRIVSQRGMINRYGLNSHGATLVAARLRQRVREFAYKQGYGLGEDAEQFVLDGGAGVPPGSLVKGKLLSVQVAKNESTLQGDIEAIRRDYVNATSLLAKYADVIVVNVSCPNEPGYRNLQQIEPLTEILTGVVAAAASVDRKVKVRTMVKVSPDEGSEEQIASICAAVWRSGVDGVVVGNTTFSRPDGTGLSKVEADVMEERGGYSGPQLFHRTVSLVKKYRRILDYPLHDQKVSHQTEQQPHEATNPQFEASAKREEQDLKGTSDESTNQPLLSIPETHSSPTTGGIGSDVASARASNPSPNLEQSITPQVSTQPATLTSKTIFCTGGITNGQQALEVLNAGASVAQIYTGMILSNAKALSADDCYDSSCLWWCGESNLYEAGDEA